MTKTWENKWKIGTTATRLSRCKFTFAGKSLRGLTSKQHMQMQRLQPKGIIQATKPLLEPVTWTKFDRGRPLTSEQVKKIRSACNLAVMRKCSDFPFTYPLVKIKTDCHPDHFKRHLVSLTSIEYIELEKTSTTGGTVYFIDKPDKDTLTYKDKTGRIAFSGHALERFLERNENIREFCFLENSRFAFLVLQYIIKMRQIQYDMLRCEVEATNTKTQERANILLGHFPLEYVDGVWIATTFLLPDMKDTPEQTDQKIKDLEGKFSGETK